MSQITEIINEAPPCDCFRDSICETCRILTEMEKGANPENMIHRAVNDRKAITRAIKAEYQADTCIICGHAVTGQGSRRICGTCGYTEV